MEPIKSVILKPPLASINSLRYNDLHERRNRRWSAIKKRILGCSLAILMLLSAFFNTTRGAEAFSSYQDNTTPISVVSYSRSEIYNDIPIPRNLSPDLNRGKLLPVTGRSHRYSALSGDQWSYCPSGIASPPDYSSNSGNLFYNLFIHPGDVIIRYIHNQDGEKDR